MTSKQPETIGDWSGPWAPTWRIGPASAADSGFGGRGPVRSARRIADELEDAEAGQGEPKETKNDRGEKGEAGRSKVPRSRGAVGAADVRNALSRCRR